MRNLAVIAGAVSLIALSVPASAAIVFDGGTVGTSYQIDFTGQTAGQPAPDISSLLTLTFTGLADGGSTYNFDYTLLNDSTISARLRSFGFDVVGATVTSNSSTGLYGYAGMGDNYPEGVGTLDVCFRVSGGNNCTGGPNGLLSGESASGTLALTFAGTPGSIALDNFTTRYQSISPKVNGASSGVGIGTPITSAVPEPATWALMILGFGAVGMGMRRRKAANVKVAYA